MQLRELLEETLNTASLECWAEESTPTPVRAFGVRLHSAGLSLRETAAVLGLFGVERSHQAPPASETSQMRETAQGGPPCVRRAR